MLEYWSLSSEAKAVIVGAQSCAAERGHALVLPEHIALTLFGRRAPAARVVERHGMKVMFLQRALDALIDLPRDPNLAAREQKHAQEREPRFQEICGRVDEHVREFGADAVDTEFNRVVLREMSALPDSELRADERCKGLLQAAMATAATRGAREVESRDLLLAILDENGSPTRRLLGSMGVDIDRLRSDLYKA